MHEGHLLPGWHLLMEVKSVQADYLVANAHISPPLDPSVPRWSRPPPGCLKINVDSAVANPPVRAAIGVIVRDRYGMIVSGQGIILPGCGDSSMIEASAISIGIAIVYSVHASCLSGYR
ncbi:hypothetical protein F3Y22_tig00002511pilonHSYRG00544 [Hibiscus syriacus]|uniref:RNase H type-1 domain-containing protein n=1 Tax=Hibiscus syriacus TaxID=106335 RepID=A0A6A3CRR2_HIBSY|nr:hypothetical protein F3Y22_tig00002511pilonHSYRG00544 [Hibiscus syriacus]